MKSINEKAKEVQIGYDDIQAPAIGTGFVTGEKNVMEISEREMLLDKLYMDLKRL